MPERAVPFPRCLTADQATCPDLLASDAKDAFSERSSDMMDLHPGHLTAQRPHSLRRLHVSTYSQDSTTLRLPSIASATTYTSSLQHPDNTCSIREVQAPGSGYAMGFASGPHQSHRMSSQRAPSPLEVHPSVFRRVSRQIFRRRSFEIPSVKSAPSLPSSPVTPNTPLFVSNPAIADFTTSPFADAGSYSNVSPDNFGMGGEGPPPVEVKPKSPVRLQKRSPDLLAEHEQTRPFHPNVELTHQQLHRARELEVLDRDGKAVRFGDLWEDQQTCVIFIRHFWCASCMDYVRSIKEQVEPAALNRAGVELVVISNSSPAMIKSYSNIFDLPFPLYTDPTCSLFRTLGMTLRTTNGGPDSERGDYIKHGAASGVAMVMKNAIRMPLHKSIGDVKQLGGEFVLGPGLRCSFVSRMHNTRSHTPINEVLSAAGVRLDLHPNVAHTFYDSEEQWMKDRDTDLKRIQTRKGMRRGFIGEHRDSESSELDSCTMDALPVQHRRGFARGLEYIKERPDIAETE